MNTERTNRMKRIAAAIAIGLSFAISARGQVATRGATLVLHADVYLGNLDQVYDGTPKPVRVTVDPAFNGWEQKIKVTYDGSVTPPTDAGSYAVTAKIVNTETWSGSKSGTLTIAKGTQNITFPEIGPQAVADTVRLAATADSGLDVVFSVIGPAYLENGVLSFSGPGTVMVTATQAGNENWQPATATQFVMVQAEGADADADGLTDAWERGVGRYEIVEWTNGWVAAKADAEARGGHLATITSEAEWVVVSNMFGTNVLGCWLGASDEEEEGVWKWVTGESWEYSRWNANQPDGCYGGQDYLQFHPEAKTLWDDGGPSADITKYIFERGYYTDPLTADTDGDGMNDGDEYESGRNPVVNDAEGTANEVVSVECRQRWPWNGLVDIDYEIGGWGTNEEELVVVLRGTAMVGGEEIELKTLTGEVTAAAGRHRMTWNSAADWGGDGVEEATVRFEIVTPYLVVDMSGGTNAANWPMTRMKNVPAGGWNTSDKTTRLVLRRIEAGRYPMGGQYDTTISKPFYMGVFEVTQRQWELATGSNPSQYKGDARPVEKVSYNMIRGTGRGAWWPNRDQTASRSPSCVDENSFLRKLRLKTGMMVDLPTEAQWEYACRAGTMGEYNNGGDAEADLAVLGRYTNNIADGKGGYSQHTKAGSYQPNAWGLHDMHGNVGEWCLDWEGSLENGATDPKGASGGTNRVVRGGTWSSGPAPCAASYRSGKEPSVEYSNYGVRLAAPAGTQSAGESEAFTLDGRAGKGEAFAAAVGVGVEEIAWSGEWAAGVEGGTAVVKEEGRAVWESAGEGEFTWTPSTAGTRVLTHEVTGTEGGRFSATFEVSKGMQSILFPSLGVQ